MKKRTITFTHVLHLLNSLSEAGYRQEIWALMQAYGIRRIEALPEAEYARFWHDAWMIPMKN